MFVWLAYGVPGVPMPMFGATTAPEAVSILLFALALAGYLRRGAWRRRGFAHWLIVALIVNLAGEAAFAPFERAVAGTPGLMPYGLALAGKVMIFVGLLVNIRSLYLENTVGAAALARSESLLHSFIDQSPAAICIRDSNFRIITINRRYAAFHGTTKEEAIGSDGAAWMPPEQLEQIRLRDWMVFQAGEPNEVEYVRNLPDGGKEYRHSIKFPLTDANGDTFGTGHMSLDVTDMKNAQAQLRRQAQIWRQMQEGVLVFDTQARVIDVNPGAERKFGWSREELLSDPSIRLVEDTDPAAFRQRMLETVRRDGQWSGEITCRRKDGTLFPVESRIAPLTDEHDRIIGLIAVNRDITARKEIENSLYQAKREADLANRAKSGFLATMSHEIRTPMNGVLGIASLLLETPLDETQRQYAEVIVTSGNALLDLINDILDVSKLEAGRVELHMQPFNPLDVIDNVRSLMAPRATEKGIGFSVSPDERIPRDLTGDPGRLRQILLNLVGNAIKFTQNGAVNLRAAIAGAGPGHVALRFEIADSGIGIPEDVRGRLFERFVQADASTTRQFGGTGLGLSICRELCALMHGEIGVDSVEGQGSTFWFTARFDVADGATAAGLMTEERNIDMAENTDAAGGEALRKRILLAEDNPVNQLVAVATLKKLGYETVVVENGQLAVEAVQKDSYAAIIMDLQMPVMDGIQATRAIRALDAPCARIPILALTADAMKGDRERCLDAGIDYYLTKPMDIRLLDTTLHEALGDDERGVA
jgi:PAS domain S-box-containing protein